MSSISTSVSDRPLIGFFKRPRRRRPSGENPGSSRPESAVVETDSRSRQDGVPATVLSEEEALFSTLRKARGAKVEAFFRSHLSGSCERTSLVNSVHREDVETLPAGRRAVGVLKHINNARRINKYFRSVNARLETGGLFLGCAEINKQRKARFFREHSPFVAYPVCLIDFLVNRICPKLPYFKTVYFAITRGRNRPVARSEVLGRLISCGFQIAEFREIDGLMYFAVHKLNDSEPVCSPTYGPLCRLKRVGIHRELITVYKMRTMHPYAEFLQEYLYCKYGTKDGNKILHDFRVAPWAGFLRRLWLDEFPMVINVLNGDLKLVGVRPISAQKFNTYPAELQELRTRFKPGLIPPFYVDMPETPEAFFRSEERYLRAYEKAPITTDLKYFYAALWNITTGKARSE